MTEPKLKRYDVTDFLEVEEDVIAYLNAALEDGHPEAIAHAIGNIARMRGMSRKSVGSAARACTSRCQSGVIRNSAPCSGS